jgi:hypothetical protein
MNKAKIIERLKHNSKRFGELTKEEQEIFEEVGVKNCVYLSDSLGTTGYYDRWTPQGLDDFSCFTIYRIKRDYKYKESKKPVTVVTLIFKGDTLIKKELTKIL